MLFSARFFTLLVMPFMLFVTRLVMLFVMLVLLSFLRLVMLFIMLSSTRLVSLTLCFSLYSYFTLYSFPRRRAAGSQTLYSPLFDRPLRLPPLHYFVPKHLPTTHFLCLPCFFLSSFLTSHRPCFLYIIFFQTLLPLLVSFPICFLYFIFFLTLFLGPAVLRSRIPLPNLNFF